MIKYKTTKNISTSDLLSLYSNAEWTSYTNDINKLKKAILNSGSVISAWEAGRLIGLIRTVGDGETICYIQDILVLKSFKRRGIGKELLRLILKTSVDIRQIVLLTDAKDIEVRKFYESQGFVSCDDGLLVAFRHLNKI